MGSMTISKDLVSLSIDNILEQELKGENLERVFIITDINRLYKLYLDRNLSVYEFDHLYGLKINQLDRALCNTRDSLERDSAYKNLQWH